MAFRLLLSAYLILAFLSVFQPLSSNDVWWHLKTAEWFFKTGEGLFTEVFSHTATGTPLPNHRWGSQFLLYAVDRIGGLAALRLAVSAVLTAVLALQFCRSGGSRALPWSLLSVFGAAAVLIPRVSPSPQLFSALFAAHLLFVLDWVRARPDARRSSLLFLWLVVWLNLHAEALLGVGLAALYFFGEWTISRSKPAARIAVLVLPLVFVQPSGQQLLGHVLRDTAVSMRHIREWEPTISVFFRFGKWGMLGTLGLLGAALFGFAVSSRLRRDRGAFLAATAAFGISLTAIREAYWLILPLAFVGRELGARLSLGRLRAWAAGAAFFLGLSILPWDHLTWSRWTTDVEASDFPVAQADFIERAGLTGNLYNFYDNGGYLLYRLYPRCRVFIDPRNYPYPATILAAHDEILYGGSRAQGLLDRYGVDLLLIRSSYFEEPDKNPRWYRAFTDGHYDVYIRNNERNAMNLARAKNP